MAARSEEIFLRQIGLEFQLHFRSAAVGMFSKLLRNCFEESCKLKVRRIEGLAQLSDKAKATKGNRSRHRQMFRDN